MKYKSIIFIGLIFWTYFSNAQNHLINYDSFNHSFLEELVLEEINHIRDSIGLVALREDHYLKLAAINHSKFLVKNERLTHLQISKKYRNPALRVKKVKGKNHRIAENITYVNVHSKDGEKLFEKTYEHLAKTIVSHWVKSSKYFKNIRTDWTATTGVSSQYDPSLGRVYVTQVLGDEPSGNLFGVVIPEDVYKLKKAEGKNLSRCEPCFNYYNNKPEDVLFGIQVSKDGYLFLLMNDKKWFHKLIEDPTDGFAVDIILKEQFDCRRPNRMNYSFASKGVLLPPRYYKNFKYTMEYTPEGQVKVLLGKVPEELEGKEFECNLVLIQEKHVCHYHMFFNIQSHRWDLLEMLLLTREEELKKTEGITQLLEKTLKFEIPFEKDKTVYSAEDIQSIYDSLSITDYTIKQIDVKAFSSIEGSTKHNLALQQKRAQSIVKALQSYQKEGINQTVFTAENWTEFAKDISNTEYAYLKNKSKEEVKAFVSTRLQDFEPILTNHRKAIVELQLEKRTFDSVGTISTVKSMLSNAVREQNIERALALQNQLFKLANQQKLSYENASSTIEIPKEKKNSILLNNELVLNQKSHETPFRKLYGELKELEKLDPENSIVEYNLAVTMLHLWSTNEPNVKQADIAKRITELSKKNFDKNRIGILRLNFNILLCEELVKRRQYKEKDQVLRQIYDSYKVTDLSESDLLSLAKYFVSYAKFRWAEEILAEKARQIDVEENLLFYYINLTIIDETVIRKGYYREILHNAVNLNNQRYCDLFKGMKEGGITFQLLENDFLKRVYCDNCR